MTTTALEKTAAIEEVDGANFSPFAIKIRHDGQVHNSSGVANGFPNDAFSDFSHFGLLKYVLQILKS